MLKCRVALMDLEPLLKSFTAQPGICMVIEDYANYLWQRKRGNERCPMTISFGQGNGRAATKERGVA